MKYAKGKGIGYKKECSEFSATKCRKTFFTSFKTKCSSGYKKICKDSYGKKAKWWVEDWARFDALTLKCSPIFLRIIFVMCNS